MQLKSKFLMVCGIGFALGAGCGERSTSLLLPVPEAAVEFVYGQPLDFGPLPDPHSSRTAIATCLNRTPTLELRPGWSTSGSALEPSGPRSFRARLDVPTGTWVWVQLRDPFECSYADDGAVTVGLSANGVALTRVVATDGGEALSFRVAVDGRVTP